MGIKADQERVKTLLKDTITLLCKNGLSFKSKFSIEAVIGVTLDEDDVFLLSMNDVVKTEGTATTSADSPTEQKSSSRTGIDDSPRRKRKRRHMQSETGGTSDKECSSSDEDTTRFKETLSDGVPDNDRTSGPSSPKKQHEISKQEPDDDDSSSSKDIIYVKEEPRESWTEHPGPSQHLDSLPDFSQASFSQEPNFSMLPGLGDINNPEWPATSIGMLPTPPSSQRLSWQSGGLATMDRLQGQDGENSQQLDSSQMSENDHSFPCMVCGKSFSRRYSWKMHMNLHQGKYNIYCKICNKGFNNSYTLKGHMSNVHTGIKDFKCNLCGKEFGYKHHLKSHYLRSHHVSGSRQTVQSQSYNPPTPTRQSPCDLETNS